MNITVKTEIKKKSDRTTAVCRNGRFSTFLETFVLVESSGIFSNFSAENPPLLQAANRYSQPIQQKISSKTERDFFIYVEKTYLQPPPSDL